MKEERECIFCNIINGKSEASVVYEDDNAIAIMDIQPVNPGHVLIIPKTHLPFINEANNDTGEYMFKIGLKVAAALKKSGLQCEGVNYLLADGEAAGQEVFHAHLHVFPRFKNDGFGFRFTESYYTLPPREKLNSIAEEIKKYM
jgi:histidine triad (HIT) family protein